MTISEQAHALLRRFYGYDSFRPGQLEIIQAAASGRDAVVIMPTGGGKSMCYQIPALLADGCAIIVSPLIALMNDQVMALSANGIPAAAINSNVDETTNRTIMEHAFAGRIKLLYVSPERLMADMPQWSEHMNISLFAIDEAHCISQWGHDFRPVYTSLAAIRDKYPDVPIMALTATADRLTRDDIATQLHLRNPFKYVGSFDRPNISISVVPDPGLARRITTICKLIDEHPQDSGIVYCLSRKKAENMHAELVRRGYKAVCYHAGMSANARNMAQQAFVDGSAQVVCATIAFGMGIDKSNIRWVVHNNMSQNIESYYQEIGRAGRDGLPAQAILFYSLGDVITLRKFAEESGRPVVNIQKLERMKEFAEASVCRRRILLSYFNEETHTDCHNCDVCFDPPARFDGTKLAQMAISAVIRTEQKIGAFLLVDILRGSARAEVLQRGFDRIKTYGVGRDLSAAEWRSYISQMLQLGVFEIAYNDNMHLRVTPFGMRVVRGEEQLIMAKYFQPHYQKKAKAKTKVAVNPDDLLLSNLKAVRAEVAKKDNLAPYMVLSDATLLEIVKHKPADLEAFAKIYGVGEVKAVNYWRQFVGAVRKAQKMPTVAAKGSAYKETLMLHRAGKSADEIANIRGVQTSTVYNHYAQLIDDGEITDFRGMITRDQYQIYLDAMRADAHNALRNITPLLPPGMPYLAAAISRALAKK
jgi:ATP-dependent DNA helicase RecQ